MFILSKEYIDRLLSAGVKHKASDLHLTVGIKPTFRINGQLTESNEPILLPQFMKELFDSFVISEVVKKQYEKVGDGDFNYSIQGMGRFRVNVFKQRGSPAFAIRIICNQPPTLDDLAFPEVTKKLTRYSHGLVLVTGPTGSGKSTTLAAMINQINMENRKHIVTLEQPIEYLHKHNKSIVNQREVPTDSATFNDGLRAVLREDPNIIMVGEMRDPETILTAINAAETGHLVLSSLHTGSAAESIGRIIDGVSIQYREQVRIQLSSVLLGVISQHLFARADDKGMVAALEIMIGTNAIRSLVREGKVQQLEGTIQTGGSVGMMLMEKSVKELVRKHIITQKDADEYLNSKKHEEFDKGGLMKNFKGEGRI